MTSPSFAPLPLPRSLAELGISEVIAWRVALRVRFRGIDVREGLFLRGNAGWGECSPFWDYPPRVAARWLLAGIEAATSQVPSPLRERVDLNVTIPILSPKQAKQRVIEAGAQTAKVKVAGAGTDADADLERLRAVSAGLKQLQDDGQIPGPGRIRIDANGYWSVDEAAAKIEQFTRACATAELEYVEQPVASLTELADLAPRAAAPIAADEAIRLAADPLAAITSKGFHVAVLKIQPLGGIRSILELARHTQRPVVISSALDSSIGIWQGLRAAAALESTPACGLGTLGLFTADPCGSEFAAPAASFTVPRQRPTPDFSSWLKAREDESWVQAWRQRLDQILDYQQEARAWRHWI